MENSILEKEQLNNIIEFIDNNFVQTVNSEAQYGNAKLLSSYLIKNKLNINEFDSEILLNKSQKLNEMFKILVLSETLSKLSSLKELGELTETYCIKNGIIDIEDIEETYELNLLKLYLDEIKDIKVLTPEEEKELIIKIQNGDEEAKYKLIKHNLRYVVFIAKRFRRNEIDFLDLIQYGNEGLIEAVERVLPKDNKFISYAQYHIRRAIYLGLSNSVRTIKVPPAAYNQISNMKKIIAAYKIEHKRNPTNEELAEIMGLTPNRIEVLKEASKPILSLNRPFMLSNNKMVTIDTIENPSPSLEELAENQFETELLKKLCKTLKERELYIIKHRFGLDGSEIQDYTTLSEKINLSKERIRQIEKKALYRLREIYILRERASRKI